MKIINFLSEQNVGIEKHTHYNKTDILLFLSIVFLYKPTTLGAILTPVAMFLSVALILLTRRKVAINNKLANMTIAIIICYLYFFAIDILKRDSVEFDQLKAMVSIVVLLWSFFAVLNTPCRRELFKRYLICVLCFFAISCTITNVCSLFISDANSMRLLSIDIPVYGYRLDIYFPFTPATGRISLAGRTFVRLSAFFRECGIAQLFYCWGFAEAKFYFKKKKRTQIILLLGLLFCQSTAGYFSLLLYAVCWLAFNCLGRTATPKKIILFFAGIIFVLAAIWIVLFAPVTGMMNKNALSTDARLGYYEQIFALWTTDFTTFVLGADYHILGTGVSLSQRIYYIGFLGMVLYFSIILVALRGSKNKARFILANIGGIATMFASQPIWNAPFLVLLWGMPYANETLFQIQENEYLYNLQQ